jgi:hypothetical protein
VSQLEGDGFGLLLNPEVVLIEVEDLVATSGEGKSLSKTASASALGLA